MSRKHPPTFYLPAAQSRYRIAVEECPHWDYDDDGNAGCSCCHELAEAIADLRRIRKACKEFRITP